MLAKPLFIARAPTRATRRKMINLFAIGRDNANGRFRMTGEGRLDLEWDYARENRPTSSTRMSAAMNDVARSLGGTFAPLALWSAFERLLTVHSLGGCRLLADSPDDGVVSEWGEVFGYPGLFVADGSVIPTSIGFHPAMTDLGGVRANRGAGWWPVERRHQADRVVRDALLTNRHPETANRHPEAGGRGICVKSVDADSSWRFAPLGMTTRTGGLRKIGAWHEEGCEVSEIHTATTDDGIELRLTRLKGGTKGPVLEVHGAGVHSGLFTLPTVDESFASFLVKNGYDTWLLDWRASIVLPLRQFTLDDAARYDYPAAVKKILLVTGAATVQAVVHCAGAISFFMSLASGALDRSVRCVTCSQVALHFKGPLASEVKSAIHLPDLIAGAGLDYLSPTEDPEHPAFQALFGKLVDLVHHECHSTVCHRITFLYGHLYRHANLNDPTHDCLE